MTHPPFRFVEWAVRRGEPNALPSDVKNPYDALVVRRGKLVRIFTAVDACQGFGDYLRAQLPPSPEGEVA